MCAPCWNKRNPDRPVVIRVPDSMRVDEHCCFCGEVTSAGIYVRQDPTKLACGGEHK
jgi:hypothetical protein